MLRHGTNEVLVLKLIGRTSLREDELEARAASLSQWQARRTRASQRRAARPTPPPPPAHLYECVKVLVGICAVGVLRGAQHHIHGTQHLYPRAVGSLHRSELCAWERHLPHLGLGDGARLARVVDLEAQLVLLLRRAWVRADPLTTRGGPSLGFSTFTPQNGC